MYRSSLVDSAMRRFNAGTLKTSPPALFPAMASLPKENRLGPKVLQFVNRPHPSEFLDDEFSSDPESYYPPPSPVVDVVQWQNASALPVGAPFPTIQTVPQVAPYSGPAISGTPILTATPGASSPSVVDSIFAGFGQVLGRTATQLVGIKSNQVVNTAAYNSAYNTPGMIRFTNPDGSLSGTAYVAIGLAALGAYLLLKK